MGGKHRPGRARTPAEKAARKERSRREREANKGFTGWQETLGLVKEYPARRLCRRPQRTPGVAPPCEDDPPPRRRITLPTLTFMRD